MKLSKIIEFLNVAGDVAKNLLAIGALVASIWAGFVLFAADAPFQRLADVATSDRRLSLAHGWVWLGEGATGETYKFVLEKGTWKTVQNYNVPENSSIMRSLERSNVRDDAGPWGNEISYFVTGDCVKVIDTKVVYKWVWAKVIPEKCYL